MLASSPHCLNSHHASARWVHQNRYSFVVVLGKHRLGKSKSILHIEGQLPPQMPMGVTYLENLLGSSSSNWLALISWTRNPMRGDLKLTLVNQIQVPLLHRNTQCQMQWSFVFTCPIYYLLQSELRGKSVQASYGVVSLKWDPEWAWGCQNFKEALGAFIWHAMDLAKLFLSLRQCLDESDHCPCDSLFNFFYT